MTETQPPRRIGRSIRALLVGIVVGIALTLATDFVLHRTGFFPPLGQPPSDASLAVATAYRIVYSVFGAYLIARLAPDRPMGHALLSGIIGVIASTVGAVLTWNSVAVFGPHWYPVALIVTAMPCAWLGGKLRLMQSAQSATTA